jgi:hypothetical protein
MSSAWPDRHVVAGFGVAEDDPYRRPSEPCRPAAGIFEFRRLPITMADRLQELLDSLIPRITCASFHQRQEAVK